MTKEIVETHHDIGAAGPPALDRADAERLDRRIRLMANSISESLLKLYELVEQAKAGQIHVALGYRSWTEYVADACKIEIKIDRDKRRELVGWLSDEGMSQRAIGQTLGVSKNTVTADLSQIGTTSGSTGSEVTPDEKVTSTYFTHVEEEADEFAMVDATDEAFENAIAEACDEGDLSRKNVADKCRSSTSITVGLDDKHYPRQRQQPKRKPLPDSFWRATYDLKKRVESVVRLAADDRFKKNKDQIADVNLSDLIRVRDALNGVIDQLGGGVAR